MHESWENGTKTTSHGSLQRKGMDSTKTMGNDVEIVSRYYVGLLRGFKYQKLVGFNK